MNKEIAEMTDKLCEIVPLEVPPDERYTRYCENIATALYNAGYRKQEPRIVIPIGECEVHCGTLEQYDNFLREITKDAIKGFVEKLKALPNRDVVHSYQLGCLVLSDADIDKLANEYNKNTAKVKGVTEANNLAYLVATAIVSDKTAQETAQETAEYLYKKGYRKQSDTIKEIKGEKE